LGVVQEYRALVYVRDQEADDSNQTGPKGTMLATMLDAGCTDEQAASVLVNLVSCVCPSANQTSPTFDDTTSSDGLLLSRRARHFRLYTSHILIFSYSHIISRPPSRSSLERRRPPRPLRTPYSILAATRTFSSSFAMK
jgi:hypothetical protein